MFSWVTQTAQSALATVAGTAEPVYGPEACQPVSTQEAENPKYEITPEDLKWQVPDSTCAETQTFYINTEGGHFLIVQAIFSNVANLHVSAQCNIKVFYPDGNKHWSAKAATTYGFDEERRSFGGDEFSIVLADDNNSYSIHTHIDPETVVDMKVTRTAPGFKVGKDAKTNFGYAGQDSWGNIRHVFWPDCTAEGTVEVKGEKINAAGKGIFIMALQGMKPHHAASSWNFVTFHGEKVKAHMMEFTTPPSYGSQTVNVGCILKDGELLLGSTKGTFTHTESKYDPDTEWNEPVAFKAFWEGTGQDERAVEATLEVIQPNRVDRVDVMGEVPAIIKKFVSTAVGTRPFIYQFKQDATLQLKDGEESMNEEGYIFAETTFINLS